MTEKHGKNQATATPSNTNVVRKFAAKNPLKQLLGNAKSKLQRSNMLKNLNNKNIISTVTSDQSSDGIESGKATPRRKRKKRRKKKDGTVFRSTSEPTLVASGSSSVKGASSTLSIASSKSGSASSRKSSRKIFRRSKTNSVVPSTPSSSTSPPSTSSSAGLLGSSSLNQNIKRKISTENREPVFYLDIKTQNKRLVTTRQRQEIYALNRVMTRLENERFTQFCLEKGHRGDGILSGLNPDEGYDIFL